MATFLITKGSKRPYFKTQSNDPTSVTEVYAEKQWCMYTNIIDQIVIYNNKSTFLLVFNHYPQAAMNESFLLLAYSKYSFGIAR